MTMHRLSAAKACYLSESTEDIPKPDELLKILEQVIYVSRILFSSLIYQTGYGLECQYHFLTPFSQNSCDAVPLFRL